jgi:hypothetical protein
MLPWAIRRDQSGYLRGGQQGFAVHQHHVAAYAQLRHGGRQFGRFLKGAPVSHEGGRGHNAALVRFYYGAIDAGGETEVVGVDDQAAHGASLTGRKIRHRDTEARRKPIQKMSSQKTAIRA